MYSSHPHPPTLFTLLLRGICLPSALHFNVKPNPEGGHQSKSRRERSFFLFESFFLLSSRRSLPALILRG